MSSQKKTSREWWEEIKYNPSKLKEWLFKQYRGERTACDRLAMFIEQFSPSEGPWRQVLEMIASQEKTHAEWISGLLRVRGWEPTLIDEPQRYWDQTLQGVDSFESAAASAAYAEKMRLERIKIIGEDLESPPDIREVFQRILPQEYFHAKAFTRMAGDDAMKKALANHQRGVDAIGLIPGEGF